MHPYYLYKQDIPTTHGPHSQTQHHIQYTLSCHSAPCAWLFIQAMCSWPEFKQKSSSCGIYTHLVLIDIDTPWDRITKLCHEPHYCYDEHSRWISSVTATSVSAWLRGLSPMPLPLHIQSLWSKHALQKYNHTFMYQVQWSRTLWWEMWSLPSFIPPPPSLLPLNDMQSSALTSDSVVSGWLSDSLPLPMLLCLQWSCTWDCRMWRI